MRRILLVDDKQTMVSFLSTVLKRHGFDVVPAYNGRQALDLFEPNGFDAVVSDLRMEPVDGLELLKELRAQQDDVLFILVTAYGEINAAVEALKHGVFDCLIKPFDVQDLLTTLRRGLAYRQAILGGLDLRMLVGSCHLMGNMVAESKTMREVSRKIQHLAPLDVSVLICGETGTGKALVARTIHEYSTRRDRPFLEIDCRILHDTLNSSGLNEVDNDTQLLADLLGGGTLFLDSVEVMPAHVQEELLNELRQLAPDDEDQLNEQDIPRIIASTTADLEELVTEEEFSEDLYDIMADAAIYLAPLRDRREDILPLLYHIANRETGGTGTMPTLDTQACVLLGQYAWPGNVGELELCVKEALTKAENGRITRNSLPKSILDSIGESKEKVDLKEEFLHAAFLKQFLKGEQSEVAQTIREKAKAYNKAKKRRERAKRQEEEKKRKKQQGDK